MLKFILKKIVWIIPTLFLVTLFSFFLLSKSPGDAATNLVLHHKNGQNQSIKSINLQKEFWRNQLGLNVPLFYFTVCKAYEPDSLFQIYDKEKFKIAKSILDAKYATSYKKFIPKIIWHGFKNQYHRWLFGFKNCNGIIRGDFGLSYKKNEPVISIIKQKIKWSILLSFLAIVIAYLISIPLGLKMILNPNNAKYNFLEKIFFVLYALPEFIVAVLLLVIFANPDILSILPPSGIKPVQGYSSNSYFSKLYETLPYLILPIICYTYSSLAFITKVTTTSLSEQLSFDYIKTARAKGLSLKQIITKHALKNSLFPLITVFTSIFPSIIGGSIIIESIFTIPGLGLETVNAIVAHDYPIVIAVVLISALLTSFSYVLADILYMIFDPRIKFKS